MFKVDLIINNDLNYTRFFKYSNDAASFCDQCNNKIEAIIKSLKWYKFNPIVNIGFKKVFGYILDDKIHIFENSIYKKNLVYAKTKCSFIDHQYYDDINEFTKTEQKIIASIIEVDKTMDKRLIDIDAID